jgi:hypothetical protein
VGLAEAVREATVVRVFVEGYRAKRDLSGSGLAFHPGFGPDDPVARVTRRA